MLWIGLGGFVALLVVCYAAALAISTGWRVGQTPTANPEIAQRLRELEVTVSRLALAQEQLEAEIGTLRVPA